jgi:hypothetical protein
MTSIVSTTLHSAAQLGLGVVVGGLCDSAFRQAPADDQALPATDLMWLAFETSAQVVVNGLVSVALVKVLSKFTGDMADATGAMAYALALQASQPQLMNKIELLGRHVTALISREEAAALDLFRSRVTGQSQTNKVIVAQKTN